MTKPKFTKGPWRIGDADDFGDFVVQHDGEALAIASVVNGGVKDYLGRTEEHVANAHLISAAPDMYEALLAAWEFISDEYYASNRPDGEAFPPEVRPVVSALSAALAKAMGSQ